MMRKTAAGFCLIFLVSILALVVRSQTPSGGYTSPASSGSGTPTSGGVATACGGTANKLLKLDGTGANCVASSVTDNGTTVAAAEPISSTGGITSGANSGTAGSYVWNGSTSGSENCTVNAGGSNVTCNGQWTAPTLTASSAIGIGGRSIFINTVPTILTGGCGGSGATISNTAGSAGFSINVGTGPTSAGCTITFSANTTGWIVSCNDQTTQSATVFVQKQTGSISTTSATIQTFAATGSANAPTASDVYNCTATGH